MSNSLNYQPARRNEEALEMLHAKKLRKYANVYTADNQHIGLALRIRHRTADVNPDLKLYAAYLELTSIELGTKTFIPTDFIADYDPGTNRVTLIVPLKTVENETWNREPQFVAAGQGSVEELSITP